MVNIWSVPVRFPAMGRGGLSVIGAVVVLVALGACASGEEGAAPGGGEAVVVGDLEIADAWVRAAPAAGNSAAYMIIGNAGAEADRLASAASDAATMVEIHETRMSEGVAQMVHMPDGVEIPSGASVALEPGGLHVMLMGLTRDLVDGETVAVVLQFDTAGIVTVEAPVRSAEAGMGMGGG